MNQVLQLNKFALTFLVLVLFFPHTTSASVQITEIMYDASGADSGHEWVEVTNTGSSAEDISTYKFFEDNSNHSVTVLSGAAVLPAGVSAVIITDQAKFSADWPTFSGTVLKSSFSLSNMGETIGLKDATLTLADTAVYDSSMGAAGDGNSLHRSGSSFVASIPTLGIYVGGSSPSSSSQSNSQNQSQSQNSSPTQNTSATQQVSVGATAGPATLEVDIDAEPYVHVGGGSFFTGSASDDKGPKTRARYIWNFGDGTTEEGQTVFHAYTYPGTYVVQLSAGWGMQAGIGRMTVEAAPPQVGLIVAPDGSVAITNQGPREFNAGLWSITSGGATFVIPENTVLLPHGSIRFAPAVMHMAAGSDTVLRYPNQVFVVAAIQSVREPAPSFPTGSDEPRKSSPPAGGSASATSVVTPTTTSTLAAVETSVPLPPWPYVLGVMGVALLGLGGASYMGLPRKKVTNTGTDEFEIE